MNVVLEIPVADEAFDELEDLWREPDETENELVPRWKLNRAVASLNRTRGVLRAAYEELRGSDRKLRSAAAKLEREREQLRDARGELGSANRRVRSTEGKLDRTREEFRNARRELGSANRKLRAAQEKLEREREQHKLTRKELRAERRERRGSAEKLARATAALDQERAENRELKTERKDLKEQLKAALRAAKRHTTPFSRNQPKDENERKRSGRRSGAEHGRHAHRQVPDHADEVYEAPIDEHCECGGDVLIERIADQWQTEFRAPIHRLFKVSVGRCARCGKRHQGHHALQTSDALGAAAVTLGPNAQGLLAFGNKKCGVSVGSLSRMFGWLGLPITPGGAVQVVARVGDKFQPTFDAMVKSAPHTQVVAMDATGWRIAGKSSCLLVWVLDGDVVIYMITKGHSFAEYAKVIGEDFAGAIERDGAREFRCFVHAVHQTCLNHLLKRCHLMIEAAPADNAVPSAARALFKDALALRDRRDDPEDIIDADEFGLEVRELEERADTLIQTEIVTDKSTTDEAATDEPNSDTPRKLLKHLTNEHELGALFTFLKNPNVHATNARAERGLRPMISANRKLWGGNYGEPGARTTECLASVFSTAERLGLDTREITLEAIQARAPTPIGAITSRLPKARSDPASHPR